MNIYAIYVFVVMYIETILSNYTLYIINQFYKENISGSDTLYENLVESSNDWNNNPELLRRCTIICLDGVLSFNLSLELRSNPNIIVWNLYMQGTLIDKFYYGPFPVPDVYLYFPAVKYETEWIYYLSFFKGYVVQTKRMRNHLIKRSNTYSLLNKYIIVPNCMKYKPILNNSINKWDDRVYDLIIYLKYADLNKTEEGNRLCNKLSKEYKVKVIKYGSYKLDETFEYGNKAKFVLYFSFYDVNPSALMEMQSVGVFVITFQQELIDEVNGVFLPELEYNTTEAIIKIRKITQRKYDSEFLAKYNREKHDCIKSFKKFLDQVIK